MTDKILHIVMLGMVLTVGVVLILFAHQYVQPDVVFASLIAGTGTLVGARIAANGYISSPPAAPAAPAPIAAAPVTKTTTAYMPPAQ